MNGKVVGADGSGSRQPNFGLINSYIPFCSSIRNPTAACCFQALKKNFSNTRFLATASGEPD